MSKIAVLWISAYNNIMLCPIDLKDIFSKNESCKINYEINDLKKQEWWNGLNVAYNLALLWTDSVLLSVIWNDFNFTDFCKKEIDLSLVLKSNNLLTSRFYITYDQNETKLSSFFMWATSIWEDLVLSDFSDIKIFYVWAFHINSMLSNLEKAKSFWIKTVFSPWFIFYSMTKEAIKDAFINTDILIINSVDYDYVKQKAELNDEDMISFFDNLIITYDINGSKIFDRNYHMTEVAWVSNPDFLDDVWVSDAFKAWILKWLNDGYDIKTRTQIWAVMASISTASSGSQNHNINWEQFGELYSDTFWTKL